jgi:hypothetical protein
MLNARRFECFCVDPSERWMYAGNTSGQITVIDIDRWAILHDYQAHTGTMRALQPHPSMPYLGGFANDRCVSVWHRLDDGTLVPAVYVSVRDIPCANDEFQIEPIFSHTVAFGFHPTERRFVTRTGNGGVVEMAFDDGGCTRVLSSARFHGDWDVQFTQYVPGTDQVLSGGRDGCLVLSEKGEELKRWSFGGAVVHWAEQMEGTTYLIASDAGLVAKLDIASDEPPHYGQRFAIDDMEYVSYNHGARRAFATSFDRHVYEIDPDTCDSRGVAFDPGYKTIWVKSLERQPATLLVQSRNGGLYKADADTGATLGVIKETPDALWSGVHLGRGDLMFAGEGNALTRLTYTSTDPISRTPNFEVRRIPLDIPADTYTKRLVRQPSTGRLVLARTNGDIYVGDEHGVEKVINLGSAVRDIAVKPTGDEAFAATENGQVVALDLRTGEIRNRHQSAGAPFPLAVWALAYNPVADLLAFAEFGGSLRVVKASDFSEVDAFEAGRPKRMKWADADTLLFGKSDEVHRYSVNEGKSNPIVTMMQNTVEDFIWDNMCQYLLVICYQTTIALADFHTGEKLDLVRDQIDYSKGIAWLDPSPDPRLYPYDFVTWGRSGDVHQFRVHDERIVAVGPVGPAVS